MPRAIAHSANVSSSAWGPFKCYVTPWRGWVGVKFPGKKRYVTLEWLYGVYNGPHVIAMSVSPTNSLTWKSTVSGR